MQKLLSRPVAAPFLFIFGVLLSQFGYVYLQRGSFEYTPQNGPTQIISPATNATLYWTVSAGMFALGVIFIAVAAYAALCLFRACRAPRGAPQRPRFGMFMFGFAMFIIVFTLFATTCSHH